jgi:hypothetical protein
MFQVVPQGVIALTAVLMSFALAIVLFRVGTPGSVARKLSLLLLFEGLTLGSSDVITHFMTSPGDLYERFPWLDMVQGIIHTFGDCGMIALYPPFLAAALRTRLTRPFADKRGGMVCMALAAMLFVFVVLMQGDDVAITVLYLCMSLVFSYAMVASIHAWYVATGSARSRARIFTLAFGFRDICWNFFYATGIWIMWFAPELLHRDENPAIYVVYALGTLIAVPLIAYGILRTQLFDIDLKIRWTIKQSTLAGVIIAIVFAVSEGASQFLSAELGNVFGLLAAAVVMFFLAPLQRFAENVASAAMPNTQNTPEYAAFRKMQVYEEAVTEAHTEGGISDKERSLLVRLRDSLGISESDARTIESELLTGAI